MMVHAAAATNGSAARAKPSSTIAAVHQAQPLAPVIATKCGDGSARGRLRRIIAVFVLFTVFSIRRLNSHSFILNSLRAIVDTGDEGLNATSSSGGGGEALVPLPHREWDRMLFGIFTYDSPNEAEMRQAARETHLSYFRHHFPENNVP